MQKAWCRGQTVKPEGCANQVQKGGVVLYGAKVKMKGVVYSRI